MADRIDHIIKDFITGQLDVKIKIRRLQLSARNGSENIGGSHAFNKTAPQETLVCKFDEDDYLKAMEYQKEIISMWFDTLSDESRNILVLRFSHKQQWWQIGQELYLDERTVRRKYQEFKEIIKGFGI